MIFRSFAIVALRLPGVAGSRMSKLRRFEVEPLDLDQSNAGTTDCTTRSHPQPDAQREDREQQLGFISVCWPFCGEV